MAEPAGQGPLLIEKVPGEGPSFDWVPVGQALAFLGSVTVIAYAVLSIAAGASLSGGWEGTWYVPRSDFDLACPAGLAIMVLGIAIYYLGRLREGRGKR